MSGRLTGIKTTMQTPVPARQVLAMTMLRMSTSKWQPRNELVSKAMLARQEFTGTWHFEYWLFNKAGNTANRQLLEGGQGQCAWEEAVMRLGRGSDAQKSIFWSILHHRNFCSTLLNHESLQMYEILCGTIATPQHFFRKSNQGHWVKNVYDKGFPSQFTVD